MNNSSPTEVNHQERAGQRLATVYNTLDILYFGENVASNPCPLVHHAHTLKTRNAELSKQKADLVRLEEEADNAATLPYQTEAGLLPTHDPPNQSNHHFQYSPLLSPLPLPPAPASPSPDS